MIENMFMWPPVAAAEMHYLQKAAEGEKCWKIKTYSEWVNPMNFDFISNPTGMEKSEEEIEIAKFTHYIFSELGGTGYAEWNNEFISGNRIALKYYIDMFEPRIDSDALSKIKNIEPLSKNVMQNLRLLTGKVKARIDQYKESQLGSALAFING